MKKRKNSIIKLMIFLAILSICIQITYNTTKRKYSYIKTKDFFRQEENFDVLFFGTSHMIYGISPMQLWNDYGIVSYNMGNYLETIPVTYYNMLLALKETNPNVIVIDTFMANENKKMANPQHAHRTFDAYPLSYEKYLSIKDLSEEKNLINAEIEYLFNFSMYHTRWKELEKNDFQDINSYQKGAETCTAVKSVWYNEHKINSVNAYNKEETIGMQYLRKIIDYCKENNIEILLTYLPSLSNDQNISVSKYIQNICDEYNINYLNFYNIDLVDYNIDFFDEWSHLNPSGARKVTDYIGKYIVENYDIPDQRKNETYKFWNQDYNEYIDYKIKNLSESEKNLDNYLMLLYGEEDIRYEIKISSKKKIEEGSTLQKLLANINNNYEIDDEAFKDNKDKTVKITTWDNRTGKEIKTIWF